MRNRVRRITCIKFRDFPKKIESEKHYESKAKSFIQPDPPKRILSPKSTRSPKIPVVQNLVENPAQNLSYEQQILKIEESIKTQENIEAQTNKSINMGSKKEDVNSRLLLEAERVLLKAQQTKIALYRRKQVLRTELNRSLGGEIVQKTVGSGNTSLTLGSIVFKTYQIGRLTKRTYLLLSFCHKERPTELHVTPLIELHTLEQDHEGFIRYHLKKDIVFENIQPDFQIDVNIYTLTTIDLVTENFSPTSSKMPTEKSKGLRKALGKGFGRVSTKVKDRFMTMSKSESSDFTRSTSNKSISSSGKSRFDHFGNFQVNKDSIENKDFGSEDFGEEQLISAVAQDMGKGYISNEVFLTACLSEAGGAGVDSCLTRENFGNVFLPVMPPAWNYRYIKMVGKVVYFFRNLGDEQPVEVLKINEYSEIRPAASSECFQKWTIRLIKDKTDSSQKTLLRFADEEMRDSWLVDLKAIVDLTNSWK